MVCYPFWRMLTMFLSRTWILISLRPSAWRVSWISSPRHFLRIYLEVKTIIIITRAPWMTNKCQQISPLTIMIFKTWMKSILPHCTIKSPPMTPALPSASSILRRHLQPWVSHHSRKTLNRTWNMEGWTSCWMASWPKRNRTKPRSLIRSRPWHPRGSQSYRS